MTIFGSLLESRARKEGPYSISDAGVTTFLGLDQGENLSGVSVSESTAHNCSVVLACYRIISEALASIPIYLQRRDGPGKNAVVSEAVDDYRYWLMLYEPNPEMNPMSWEQAAVLNILAYGNHYSYIERRAGKIRGLWPLAPNRVNLSRSKMSRELVYEYEPDGGEPVDVPKICRPEEILHVPGLTMNGWSGLSVIAANRDTIGLTMAATRYGAAFFGNGSRPSGILSLPDSVYGKPEARKKVKESWEASQQGVGNAFRTAVLPDMVKWQQITINPEDAQWLEGRKFQIEEVARMFGVPLILLQSQEKSTSWGSGIEQIMRGFITNTLRPYMERFEHELRRKTLSRDEWRSLEYRHDASELSRGDLKSLYESLVQGVNNGIISPNTARRELGENPDPNPAADKLYIQGAMVPMELAGKHLEQSAPANEPEPEGEPEGDSTDEPVAAKSSRASILRPILVRALEVEVERECATVRKATENRDAVQFSDWLTEFSGTKLAILDRNIGHILRQSIEPNPNPWISESGQLDLWCRGHVNEFVGGIREAMRMSMESDLDSKTAVRLFLDEWQATRPERFADAVFGEVRHAA